MGTPEYLELFAQSGSMEVCVRFEGHEGYMPALRMSARDVAALVKPDGSGFHRRMCFDGWEFAIRQYEIDPANGRLTLVATPLT